MRLYPATNISELQIDIGPNILKNDILNASNIPGPQRLGRRYAQGKSRTPCMIKKGKEGKKEPTSLMRMDHGQEQDQSLDSRTGYQIVAIPPED